MNKKTTKAQKEEYFNKLLKKSGIVPVRRVSKVKLNGSQRRMKWIHAKAKELRMDNSELSHADSLRLAAYHWKTNRMPQGGHSND